MLAPALDREFRLVGFDQRFRQRQAEAGPALPTGPADLAERFEGEADFAVCSKTSSSIGLNESEAIVSPVSLGLLLRVAVISSSSNLRLMAFRRKCRNCAYP